MNKRSTGSLTRRQIARAWADPVYRVSLSAAQLAELPVHPAGAGEEILDAVRGWGDSFWSCTGFPTCFFSCTCVCTQNTVCGC